MNILNVTLILLQNANVISKWSEFTTCVGAWVNHQYFFDKRHGQHTPKEDSQ